MAASRSYSTKTIKILFGQCGNQCAEPNCTNPIIAPGTPQSDNAIIGQICHIYAASDNGPRGNPNISEEERNAPANLILLCGVHHPLVDKQYETYPASMLIAWKKAHEAKFSPETAEATRREADIQKHAFFERMSDKEIDKAVDRLRQARFLPGFAAKEEALRLAASVELSHLSGGSSLVRARALLSTGDTLPRAKALLTKSRELAPTPEASLAEAFTFAATDKPAALAFLATLATPAARGAALRILINYDGPKATLDWTERAGLDERSFDAEGRFSYLSVGLQIGRWDVLFRGAKTVTESEIAECAGLLHMLAMAEMLSAVPMDLRPSAASQVPFEARVFPLAAEPSHVAARREARQYFERVSEYAESLGLSQAANVAADYALWLELRDPTDHEAGLEHLRESMRDPTKSLRRLNLALQFGLKLDFQAIETRLDQNVALSGLGSADEAFARFSLVFAQGGPKEAALYIAKHRAQLFAHLQKSELTGIEIELLARAGSIDAANQRLSEAARDGLDEGKQEMLRRIISECSGADPIAERRATYEKTGDLLALVNLVNALEASNMSEELLPYAEKLFTETHADEDCLRVAKCLSDLDRHEDLLNFLSRNAGLVNSSVNLRSVWAWTLFRDGRFDDARNVLDTLKEYAHSATYRALRANIAISTGDWASLLVLCEEIWTDREKVTAEELLQAAQLSEIVGGPHSREMVIAATEKEPDDAAVLANAYFLAARGGREQSQQVAAWIQRAAQTSDSAGPMQAVSLKQLIDQKPNWDKRASDTLELLNAGKLPCFAAADVLGRNLLDFTLLPSLSNPTEVDVRKRSTIYAFSGARRRVAIPSGGTIAVDLSALVTLARLDLLDLLVSKFRVVIPHSTLSAFTGGGK